MPVNLSIENVSDYAVEQLRRRARRRGRSLQDEVQAIIETAALGAPCEGLNPITAGFAEERQASYGLSEAPKDRRPLTAWEVLAEVRRLGIQTPSEAAALIRADRDAC